MASQRGDGGAPRGEALRRGGAAGRGRSRDHRRRAGRVSGTSGVGRVGAQVDGRERGRGRGRHPHAALRALDVHGGRSAIGPTARTAAKSIAPRARTRRPVAGVQLDVQLLVGCVQSPVVLLEQVLGVLTVGGESHRHRVISRIPGSGRACCRVGSGRVHGSRTPGEHGRGAPRRPRRPRRAPGGVLGQRTSSSSSSARRAVRSMVAVRSLPAGWRVAATTCAQPSGAGSTENGDVTCRASSRARSSTRCRWPRRAGTPCRSRRGCSRHPPPCRPAGRGRDRCGEPGDAREVGGGPVLVELQHELGSHTSVKTSQLVDQWGPS